MLVKRAHPGSLSLPPRLLPFLLLWLAMPRLFSPADGCVSWSSYKVDHKRDKIGVFVSTVSTKIPFKVRTCRIDALRGDEWEVFQGETAEAEKGIICPLSPCGVMPTRVLTHKRFHPACRWQSRGQGTSKEYIGDDTQEIQRAVKHALQQCCQQLRAHMVRRNALREQRERKKVLIKVTEWLGSHWQPLRHSLQHPLHSPPSRTVHSPFSGTSPMPN